MGATSHHVGSRLEFLFNLRWGHILMYISGIPVRRLMHVHISSPTCCAHEAPSISQRTL